jgi:lipopolysaccharide export system protein LptA
MMMFTKIALVDRRFVDMPLFFAFLVVFLAAFPVLGQEETGPQQPIILTNADSLLGSQVSDGPVREFMGRVRFVQGNVVVTCQRAVHHLDVNRVELFGNVIVTQGAMVMKAPIMTYDGSTNLATALGGVRVVDSATTITSRSGTYSTKTHMAVFRDSVRVADDSMSIRTDTLVYERDTKISRALHSVVVWNKAGTACLVGDTAFYDKAANFMRVHGRASSWQLESDSLLVSADTLEQQRGDTTLFTARRNVELAGKHLAGRAALMVYNEGTGSIQLFDQPVVWNDSTMLVADSIRVLAPERKVSRIDGIRNAMLVSRTDTTYPDRFDQISGDNITLTIEADTLRRLTSVGNARSITYRYEDERPEGLTRFTSDTIKAEFEDGKPHDVYWLGGVHGEQHPERIVAGHVNDHRLPGFVWREDRPRFVLPPKP